MSRFNKPSVGSKTVNRAGGEAYKQSPKFAFAAILLTSFMDNQFYRTAGQTQEEIRDLLDKIDPIFVAKTAIYARNTFGMRSVTHVVAAELAHRVKGEEWTKDAYNKMTFRPDDMTETLSYYLSQYGKPIPKSLRKGWRLAFDKFDKYQLAKYRGKGKEVNLWDVLRMSHPTHTPAVEALVKDELRNTNTWEAKQSQAGQILDEVEKANAKKKNWIKLLETDKLGYMALLKNLRNIINDAPDAVDLAVRTLTDEERIRHSKVLPFRFITAYNQLEQESGPEARKVLQGISRALDTAMINVPKYDGSTLVAIDASGSMMGDYYDQSNSKAPIASAALFGASLAKSNNADIIMFEFDAEYLNYNPDSTTLDLYKRIRSSANGGGTNLNAVFATANRGYDRVIVLSDNESWTEYWAASNRFREWQKTYGIQSKIYCFDLSGYGTLQFPEQDVHFLAGFSDKVFDIMKMLESDREALVNEIEKIEL